MNWEYEYLKKAQQVADLARRLDQAERRIAAWEKVQANERSTVRFDPVGDKAHQAVKEARVEEMRHAISVCDEELALMTDSVAVVAERGISDVVREFIKTIDYKIEHLAKERVTVVRLSAIMARKV